VPERGRRQRTSCAFVTALKLNRTAKTRELERGKKGTARDNRNGAWVRHGSGGAWYIHLLWGQFVGGRVNYTLVSRKLLGWDGWGGGREFFGLGGGGGC